MAKHGRGRGGRRRPKAGKPGWYNVKATDLLHTIELRHDLKQEVVGMKECIAMILKKYDISAKDRKHIKECVEALQSATEPIAFGLSDNP